LSLYSLIDRISSNTSNLTYVYLGLYSQQLLTVIH